MYKYTYKKWIVLKSSKEKDCLKVVNCCFGTTTTSKRYLSEMLEIVFSSMKIFTHEMIFWILKKKKPIFTRQSKMYVAWNIKGLNSNGKSENIFTMNCNENI